MGEQKVKTLQGDELKTAPAAKSKRSKKTPKGRIYIHSSYNNTIITVTSEEGDVVAWSSAGMIGFKGSKKSTPYAAQRTMEEVLKKAKDMGMEEIEIYINGIGTGRESAVRALTTSGMNIKTIRDLTPIPHGGVRKKKPRRV